MKIKFYAYALISLFLLLAPHILLGNDINNEKDFNFGQIISGQNVEHSFRINNKSKEIMTIRRVKSSCGCTAVVTAKLEILPGMGTDIKATLDTSDLSGKIEKKIEVFFDKGKDSLILSLSGEVKNKPIPKYSPKIFVSQNPVQLGLLKEGEIKTFSLIIQNRGKSKLHIKNFRIGREKDGLALDKHPILPGKKIEASFSYSASRNGPIEDYLLIVSNDPANPNLFIPIRGQVN